MVLSDDAPEFLEQFFTLFLVQLVDVFGEWAEGKDTLPACNGICAHYWMHSAQLLAHVLRATALFLVQLDALGVGLRGTDEAITDESCG
jgi:hypothetical protein